MCGFPILFLCCSPSHCTSCCFPLCYHYEVLRIPVPKSSQQALDQGVGLRDALLWEVHVFLRWLVIRNGIVEQYLTEREWSQVRARKADILNTR